MKYSDKEKAALAYHERLHEMYAIMESKRRKPMKKLKDIDREQISDQTKLYALLGAAQVSAASATMERCRGAPDAPGAFETAAASRLDPSAGGATVAVSRRGVGVASAFTSGNHGARL